jgi:hypothetical protein
MAAVSVEDGMLVIELRGWEAIFALKRRIEIPLSHVESARAGEVTELRPGGLRAPGTYLPRVIAAGSYWWKGRGWSFWSVRHPAKAIDIRVHNERYGRIVVEVDDPEAAAATIERAVEDTSGSTAQGAA